MQNVIVTTTQSTEMTIVVHGDHSPSLTVLSGSFSGSWETLDEGVLQFSDRSYTLSGIPSQWVGSKYFKASP